MKSLILFLTFLIFVLPFRTYTESFDSIKQEFPFLLTRENLDRHLPLATSSYPDDKWGNYSAESAFDNNIETSWVEGRKDSGIGERLLFEVPDGTGGIQILPGYGKESVFYVNDRLKKIRMQFYLVKYNPELDWDKSIANLELITSIDFTFQDVMEFQVINFGKRFFLGSEQYNRIFCLLRILSVYEGKDNDTCIAEIRFTDGTRASDSVASEEVEAPSLIGVWQNSPMMASGWGNTYRFFEKTFIFHYSQMDCSKRDISFSGTWKITGDKLILEINEKTHVVGGRLVEASGSCASDKMLIEGKTVSSKVSPAESEIYIITKIMIGDTCGTGIAYPKIDIGGAAYWQFGTDPESYN